MRSSSESERRERTQRWSATMITKEKSPMRVLFFRDHGIRADVMAARASGELQAVQVVELRAD
jgi:hypothetical protein